MGGESPWHEGHLCPSWWGGAKQRNREGSTLCRPSIHPQRPLKYNTAVGPRRGCPDAVALYALEWWRRRRLSEYLLGWGAINDARIKRLLGVVYDGRGIVNGLIEEASKLVSMYKLRMLVFWEMDKFVRNLLWTTIMSDLLVTVPHHHSTLQWIVMKVICSFCVLEMRHMQSECGWQELCPNQILQLLALIFDRFRWNTTNRRHGMKMWLDITHVGI